MSVTPQTTALNKQRFIKALCENRFNIGAACKATNIGRGTVRDWKRDDKQFVQDMEDALDHLTDWVEQIAYDRMLAGSDKLIERFLKTKGKKSGWVDDIKKDDNGPQDYIIGIDGEEDEPDDE